MPEIPTPKLVLVNGSGILEVVTRGQRSIFLHLTSGPSYETTLPMTEIANLFRSLNIEICDLFEIWCLRFGIFNTLVSCLPRLMSD